MSAGAPWPQGAFLCSWSASCNVKTKSTTSGPPSRCSSARTLALQPSARGLGDPVRPDPVLTIAELPFRFPPKMCVQM